mgnify:CR=1 FL=1
MGRARLLSIGRGVVQDIGVQPTQQEVSGIAWAVGRERILWISQDITSAHPFRV